jgi:hypothetical protein
MEKDEERLHRVVTFLNRKELDFLDNLSKDILFSIGVKVARSTVLRNLVDLYLEPTKEKVNSYQELLDLLIEKSKGGRK